MQNNFACNSDNERNERKKKKKIFSNCKIFFFGRNEKFKTEFSINIHMFILHSSIFFSVMQSVSSETCCVVDDSFATIHINFRNSLQHGFLCNIKLKFQLKFFNSKISFEILTHRFLWSVIGLEEQRWQWQPFKWMWNWHGITWSAKYHIRWIHLLRNRWWWWSISC